jgi:YVTN family beta-propeller protein
VNPAGSYVYVTNSGLDPIKDDRVSVIDTAPNAVVATVPVGDAPLGVAVAPDGRRVYVTNSASNSVSVESAQARWGPGRPSWTTKLARVRTGAPGRWTVSTTRRSVLQWPRSATHRR